MSDEGGRGTASCCGGAAVELCMEPGRWRWAVAVARRKRERRLV